MNIINNRISFNKDRFTFNETAKTIAVVTAVALSIIVASTALPSGLTWTGIRSAWIGLSCLPIIYRTQQYLTIESITRVYLKHFNPYCLEVQGTGLATGHEGDVDLIQDLVIRLGLSHYERVLITKHGVVADGYELDPTDARLIDYCFEHGLLESARIYVYIEQPAPTDRVVLEYIDQSNLEVIDSTIENVDALITLIIRLGLSQQEHITLTRDGLEINGYELNQQDLALVQEYDLPSEPIQIQIVQPPSISRIPDEIWAHTLSYIDNPTDRDELRAVSRHFLELDQLEPITFCPIEAISPLDLHHVLCLRGKAIQTLDLNGKLKNWSYQEKIELFDMLALYCPNLRRLFLASNSITPVELGSLFRNRGLGSLTHLELGNNPLGCLQIFAHELAALTSLVYLNLERNYLTSYGIENLAWVFQHLPNLTYLNLAHNFYNTSSSPALAQVLGSCTNLEHLDLTTSYTLNHDPQGVIAIIDSIKNISNLTHLNLTGIPLPIEAVQTVTGVVERASRLKHLSLQLCTADENVLCSLARAIRRQTSLTHLRLRSSPPISHDLFEAVSNLHNLVSLDLTGIQLSGSMGNLPDALFNHPNLSDLSLCYDSSSIDVCKLVQMVRSMPYLERLFLVRSGIHRRSEGEFGHLIVPAFSSLKKLELVDGSLRDADAQAIAAGLPPHLQSLRLRLSSVGQQGAQALTGALARLPQLQQVSLKFNPSANADFFTEDLVAMRENAHV